MKRSKLVGGLIGLLLAVTLLCSWFPWDAQGQVVHAQEGATRIPYITWTRTPTRTFTPYTPPATRTSSPPGASSGTSTATPSGAPSGTPSASLNGTPSRTSNPGMTSSPLPSGTLSAEITGTPEPTMTKTPTVTRTATPTFTITPDARQIVTWTPYAELSGSRAYSNSPAVVTDRFGRTHVFWGEDTRPNAERLLLVGFPTMTDSIYYSYRDENGWSKPVDLFTERTSPSHLAVVIDQTDTIYLAWREPGGIHYSSAPLLTASSVKSWKPDVILSPSTGFNISLMVDKNNVLHLAYAQQNEFDPIARVDNKDGNLYYIQSRDSGSSWDFPIKVSNITADYPTQADEPGLSMDANGRLHIVWNTIDPPNWTGTAIYYSYSDDNGATWQEPKLIDQTTATSLWSSKPKIITRTGTEVHITWACGRLAFRCHTWTQDGGKTWSKVEREIFGDLNSLAYWDAQVIDSSGTLYWIMQLRYPEGIYYSYWDGDHWLNPPIMAYDNPKVAQAHGPRADILNGNRLEIVAVSPPLLEYIWFFEAVTRATETPPVPVPTLTPVPPTKTVTPVMSLTPAATIAGAASAGPISTDVQPVEQVRQVSYVVIMLAGVLPAVVLFFGIYIIRQRR